MARTLRWARIVYIRLTRVVLEAEVKVESRFMAKA
jgi:hypothetical protein